MPAFTRSAVPHCAAHIRRADDRGTVLLLALIIMSSVVLSSMGLGTLIVSSLQQSRAIDAATVAYYAAESGAEQALYQARREDVMPATVAVPVALGNGASWKRTVSATEAQVYLGTLARDAFTEVAMYDPDAAVAAGSGVDHVDVTWNGTGTLQASMVGWAPGSAWDPGNAASTAFNVFSLAGGSGTLSVPDPAKLYRLRIRAAGAGATDVRIKAYATTGSSSPVPLPGRVHVDSRGSYGTVEQKLLVSVPRKVPLSALFDYVVFSECSIVKGGVISCP